MLHLSRQKVVSNKFQYISIPTYKIYFLIFLNSTDFRTNIYRGPLTMAECVRIYVYRNIEWNKALCVDHETTLT